MEYDVVIGLEVHAQMSTKSKIWCSCEINTQAYENTKVCEVCSAQPGSLPVLNKKVLENAVMLSLATKCKVNHESYFDRKNYFYPDLPKGYQITQYQVPIAQDGEINIVADNGEVKKVRIERIQIEEDTGKSTHDKNSSLINLNRCGTPLLEIVGRPDITSAKEASSYLRNLHAILTYLEICHGNLQEGNFRCDVNLSLKPKNSEKLGTRTEIKNLNSFKFAEKAIELEIERQKKTLECGEKVTQVTLNFDPSSQNLHVLRVKSDAHDYRYFPEPDLPPLVLSDESISEIKNKLPELPEQKKNRFVSQYQIPAYDADVLTSSKELANYFETACTSYHGEGKKVSNWIMTELLRLLNEYGTHISKAPVSSQELATLLNRVMEGKISGKMAKDVFQKMYDEKSTCDKIISELGLSQISDDSAIIAMAQKVLANNQDQVKQYLGGKDRLFGFFVGQLMKETKGQANPDKANAILKQLLDSLKK